MICPVCQHLLRAEARFCDGCGRAITGQDAPPRELNPTDLPKTVASDPMIGRVIDAKYKIIEILGTGGMGKVYRARRVRYDDEVAVKVLHKQYADEPSIIERFRREARAAARLHHPNIVTIYDDGEAQGDDAPAYIVMELVDGVSLRDLLKREDKLEPERAISLMRDICAGVSAAHRHNIVHRDLKPDNIIVLPPNEDRESETVKVVDFGIAKLCDLGTGNTLTQTGTLIGTPYYMSPEQCRGESLDARSDVYSLGAMLYEMLSGAPPFTAETPAGVITKHLLDPPPPLPAELCVHRSLENVIMRALAKEANLRQTDAAMLSREVQESRQRKREESEPKRGEAAARLKQNDQRRHEQNVPESMAKATSLSKSHTRVQRRMAGLVALLGISVIVVTGLVITSLRTPDANLSGANTISNGNMNSNKQPQQPSATANRTRTLRDDFSVKKWSIFDDQSLHAYYYSGEYYLHKKDEGGHSVYSPTNKDYRTKNATVRVAVRSLTDPKSYFGYGLYSAPRKLDKCIRW